MSWEITEEGELIVQCEGPMYSAPWKDELHRVRKLTIREGCTSICILAFNDATELAEVALPQSLRKIEIGAFAKCRSLASIRIPSGVTEIGKDAFTVCLSLSRVDVDADNSAYASIDGVLYTKDFTSIILCPSGYQGRVEIPDGVTSISDNAFNCCSGLTQVTIPQSVVGLGVGCFAFCTQLEQVVFSDGITAVPKECFSGCTALKEIVLPDTLLEIGESAFSQCNSLTEITIPGSVKKMGINAFYFCGNLRSVILCDGVIGVSDGAFYNCGKLESVVLPDSVVSIGKNSFLGCMSLRSLTLPENLAYIADGALDDCFGLTELVFCGDAPATAGEFLASGSILAKKITAHYPSNRKGWTEEYLKNFSDAPHRITWVPYQLELDSPPGDQEITLTASGAAGEFTWELRSDGTLTVSGNGILSEAPWSDYIHMVRTLRIREGCTGISDSVFYEHFALSEVILPESLTAIGDRAFACCQSLRKIYIPSGVTELALSAFANCRNLIRFIVSENNTAFSSNQSGVLYSKDGSTLLLCPAGYRGCCVVPDGVVRIGIETDTANNAFSDCIWLTGLTLPDTLTTISDYAFYNCKELDSLTIPNGVSSIGNYAFYQCEDLLYLRIPGSVESIGSSAFGYCTLLKSVLMESGVKTIAEHAFIRCNSMQTLQLPDTLTDIRNSAFYQCWNLVSVRIPASVESIGSNTFGRCSDFQTMYFYGLPPQIGSDAFSDKTTKAYYPGDEPAWSQEFLETLPQNIQWLPYTPMESPIPGEEMLNIVVQGTCGSSANWFLDLEGRLVIYGNGPIAFADKDGVPENPWTSLRDQIKQLYILDGITAIADKAFYGFVCTDAFIGADVAKIGKEALDGTYLRNIYFYGDMPEISKDAFPYVCDVHFMSGKDWPNSLFNQYGSSVSFRRDDCHIHEYTEVITEPTCTEWGYTTQICACGRKQEIERVGPKGHAQIFEDAREPDCTQKGRTAGRHCSVCDFVMEESHTTDALGHSYQDGVCVRCGAQKPAYSLGDVNGDGKVNVTDAMVTLRFAVKKITKDDLIADAADVNGDGKINVTDAMQILRYAVKKIVSFS